MYCNSSIMGSTKNKRDNKEMKSVAHWSSFSVIQKRLSVSEEYTNIIDLKPEVKNRYFWPSCGWRLGRLDGWKTWWSAFFPSRVGCGDAISGWVICASGPRLQEGEIVEYRNLPQTSRRFLKGFQVSRGFHRFSVQQFPYIFGVTLEKSNFLLPTLQFPYSIPLLDE